MSLKNVSQGSGNEELLGILEEQQDEIEQLKQEKEDLEQKVTSQASTLQKQASTLQKQASTLQKQESLIAELKEKIETLHKSDLQLQQSEQIRKSAEEKLEEAKNKERSAKLSETKSIRILEDANRKEAAVQETIDRERERIQRNNDQKLKDASASVFARNTAPAVAVALYAVILTVGWASAHWDTIATWPQWFMRRGDNISAVAGIVAGAIRWVHDIFPESLPELIRYAIPVIIAAACIAAGICIAVRAAVKALENIHKNTWDYMQSDEKRLKKAVIASLCAISVYVSVSAAEMENMPFHWLTLYLFLSLLFSIGYVELSE